MHMTKSEIESVEHASQLKPNLAQRIIAFWDQVVNGKRPKHHEIDILFGAQAAGRLEHGRLVGTWVKEGYHRPINISFHIKGFNELPPRLDMAVLVSLYDQASFNGIIVSHLGAYAALSQMRNVQGPTRNAKLG